MARPLVNLLCFVIFQQFLPFKTLTGNFLLRITTNATRLEAKQGNRGISEVSVKVKGTFQILQVFSVDRLEKLFQEFIAVGFDSKH